MSAANLKLWPEDRNRGKEPRRDLVWERDRERKEESSVVGLLMAGCEEGEGPVQTREAEGQEKRKQERVAW